MVVQLEAYGLPTLLNLLLRENMLAAIRARDLGHAKGPDLEVFFKRAEASVPLDPILSGIDQSTLPLALLFQWMGRRLVNRASSFPADDYCARV